MSNWLRSLDSLQAATVLTAVEVVADTAAKLGDNDKRFFDGYNKLVCYAGYNTLAYVLQEVLPQNSIAITNAYWNAFTNVTHALIGSIAFGETLTTAQIGGIGLITVGILMLKA